MKLIYAVIIACCFMAIAACAPLQPRLQELQLPPDRIVQKGYSLMPLNEKGWLIAGRNQYQVALAKLGTNQDETFAIQGMPFKLPEFQSKEEFISLIKEGQAKDTDPQRFRIKTHEVVSYPKKGSNCVKSYLVTEDNAAVKRSRTSGSMILEVLTLTCAHPKNTSVGVNVTYSHRYYPKQVSTEFIEKATNVIDSFEFSDL